jgi:D-erythritol 1-phosphate dehydrogenase
MPAADFDAYLAALQRRHGWLPAPLARHYARLYGTRAEKLINGARSLKDLGHDFGDGLFESEIDYLRASEWAMTAEDILDRRTKHGLHLDEAQRAAVTQFIGG